MIEDSDAEQGQQKGALYITTGGSTIVRSATFADSFVTSDYAENVSFHRFEAEWAFPQLRLNDVVMQARQYDTDSLLLASPFGAVMIELEQSASPYQGDGARPPNWADECQLEWAYTATPSNPMTAFNIVTSPWDEEVDLVMTGLDLSLIHI